ncbi:Ribosomal RNA small subunit methyltransferase B [Anaerohalosphaera lusitana]|uniref:Ribosomal RNA small subunit methyltransferase B n=1 Tax=Anaerohalosphaera lusitana TaxID=1936003 RepID=A0A1U9NRC3_9BACT|nr:transcription antitermination factor NusB [Anaerohalosphaera lusitana]AQT70355.1 Ribosomal RNA small subunit methyltransferase B [Anaerohalosphaera lusitana]
MGDSGKVSARAVALLVLGKFDPAAGDASEVLYRYIGRTEGRGQATDIVFGVIRHRKTIDHLLALIGNVQAKRVQKRLMNVLRIGVYELVFAAETAEYAIVNEAVELARTRGGRRQAGFVNAVLRNVGRAIAERKCGADEADKLDFVPVSARWGCRFKRDVLPDEAEGAGRYLGLKYSLPGWLAGKWAEQFGRETAERICLGSNRKPGVWIRPNRLKTTLRELCSRFGEAGVEFDLWLERDMLRLRGGVSVPELPGYDEGLFSVQDPTAAKVGEIVGPKAGEVVLDMCAAPGGKTTHMAELMGDEGLVIASDVDTERLGMVVENCQRLGISAVKAVDIHKMGEAVEKAGGADRVLVDVPCSNTGVMARRCEVRLRINHEKAASLAGVQYGILTEASKYVKQGGAICYSTCSIMDEENCAIVRRFLEEHEGWSIESEELTLPGVGICGEDVSGDHDGGYACLLRRYQC